MTRYFEDLGIGETVETGGYNVEKPEIKSFAEQFDPQPFHVDEAAARDSIFGELIASGLHTLCLATKLYTEDFLQDDEVAILGGHGMDDLRFSNPVYPGDTLRNRIEILDKTPSENRSDRGYVELGHRVSTEDAEVLSLRMHAIVARKPE